MNYKSIQEVAQGLAVHLRESAPTVSDLPEESILTSFLLEALRYQLGATTTHVAPVGLMSQAVMQQETAVIPSAGASTEQVGGKHYKGMKIQHAEFCQVNQLPWCESAAIKYLCRHKNKNGLQDLQKAIHYIRLAAEFEYKQQI